MLNKEYYLEEYNKLIKKIQKKEADWDLEKAILKQKIDNYEIRLQESYEKEKSTKNTYLLVLNTIKDMEKGNNYIILKNLESEIKSLRYEKNNDTNIMFNQLKDFYDKSIIGNRTELSNPNQMNKLSFRENRKYLQTDESRTKNENNILVCDICKKNLNNINFNIDKGDNFNINKENNFNTDNSKNSYFSDNSLKNKKLKNINKFSKYNDLISIENNEKMIHKNESSINSKNFKLNPIMNSEKNNFAKNSELDLYEYENSNKEDSTNNIQNKENINLSHKNSFLDVEIDNNYFNNNNMYQSEKVNDIKLKENWVNSKKNIYNKIVNYIKNKINNSLDTIPEENQEELIKFIEEDLMDNNIISDFYFKKVKFYDNDKIKLDFNSKTINIPNLILKEDYYINDTNLINSNEFKFSVLKLVDNNKRRKNNPKIVSKKIIYINKNNDIYSSKNSIISQSKIHSKYCNIKNNFKYNNLKVRKVSPGKSEKVKDKLKKIKNSFYH